MDLITNLNFDANISSFDFNGNKFHFINSKKYDPPTLMFKFKTPFLSTINDRFLLVGDGNITDEDGKEIVFVILKKRDGSHYTLPRASLQENFLLTSK